MSRSTSPPGLFGTLWRIGLVGIILLGAAGAAGYATVHHLVRTPEVEAPNLLTLPLEDAVAAASADGFAVRLIGRESTSVLTTGRVVAQRPLPGAWAKEGATIHLTLAE